MLAHEATNENWKNKIKLIFKKKKTETKGGRGVGGREKKKTLTMLQT